MKLSLRFIFYLNGVLFKVVVPKFNTNILLNKIKVNINFFIYFNINVYRGFNKSLYFL